MRHFHPFSRSPRHMHLDNLMLQLVPPRIWFPLMQIVWGVLTPLYDPSSRSAGPSNHRDPVPAWYKTFISTACLIRRIGHESNARGSTTFRAISGFPLPKVTPPQITIVLSWFVTNLPHRDRDVTWPWFAISLSGMHSV